MGMFRTLSGDLRLRITSADAAGALEAVSRAGICVRDISVEDELTFCFTVARNDYRKTAAITARRGDRIRIMERMGLYWDLKGLRRRPVFVLGLLFLLVMALVIPSRIFIIQVQGNVSIPSARILEAAEGCGITFGASRRAVRSEKMKNALLEVMPELGWAGVNTYGCRAVISVRERAPEPEEPSPAAVSHIIAARDGYILSCDVVSGNGLCVPGQAVKAGEILISGYTDCGICITATRAEGEVMAATSRSLTAVTPAQCLKKGSQIRETVRFSLIVGKNRINFHNNSGILDASCGRMVTNYHLTLPGGYPLPVILVKETFTQSHWTAGEADGAALEGFASRCLGTQMIAGTVTNAVERITRSGGIWILQGDYACTEMIARVRAEQNGELHETD